MRDSERLMKTSSRPEKSSFFQMEELLETATGRHRVDILNKLAAVVIQEDRSRGAAISSQALGLSDTLEYLTGRAHAMFGLGEAARLGGEYRSALEHYTSALNDFESLGDYIQLGRCYRRLGDVQYYINNLNISLKHYLKALSIFEKASSKDGSIEAKINCGHLMATIGNVLRDSGDLDGSLDYYSRCHSIYMREGFSAGIPGILHNTGNILYSQGSFEEALKIYMQSLEEAETAGDGYLASMALSSIGSVYMDRKELDTAAEYFIRSFDVAERHGRKRGILFATIKLTQLKRIQGDLNAALAYSESAEKLAKELDHRRDRADALREKALIYRGMRKYKLAFETSLAFQTLREEFLSEKRIRELDILRIRYETEVRQREIGQLRREGTVQRRVMTGAVMGLVFAGISLVLAFRNVRFRARANRKLADAYSRVEKLSQIDTLTGLANRRAMMKSLAEEQNRSKRTERSFGIIMSDIDDFKRINDHYGHACGDEVLVEVSRRLNMALRSNDIIARWGGEEFLILLPETTLKGAVKVAEKSRILIKHIPFKWGDNAINMTMTFGVSEGGTVPVDDAIQLADKALYRGKMNGKNRVGFQRVHIQ
jgi:diguanylate cyclase (GGDEF)-like protein